MLLKLTWSKMAGIETPMAKPQKSTPGNVLRLIIPLSSDQKKGSVLGPKLAEVLPPMKYRSDTCL